VRGGEGGPSGGQASGGVRGVVWGEGGNVGDFGST
jgi:hypothetical protein